MNERNQILERINKRKPAASPHAPSSNGQPNHKKEPETPKLDDWPDPIPLSDEPDVPVFPLETLPSSLSQFAKELAWAMNVPVDFVGVSMIVLAAGAIGNTYRLRISDTHSQPALIFAALVGPPGSAKSPVLKHLTKPFDDEQSKRNEEFVRRLDVWKEANPKDRGEKPELKLCIARNFTTESLALSMHYNPRGFVAPIDELSALFAGLNQYKGGNGNDRQIYLSIWAQETVNILRKNDMRLGIPPIWVVNPCLSIVGGIQPDMLACIRGQAARGGVAPNDGGIDRFMFAWPKSLPEVPDEGRCVNPELLDVWPAAVNNLLFNLQLDLDGPQIVQLSAEARAVWVAFTQEHANEINSGEAPEFLHGPWAKLKAYVLRLALTLHLLRWACEEHHQIKLLDESSMSMACGLVGYFKAHARKLHARIDSDPMVDGVRKVLKWLQSDGCKRFQKRTAFEAVKGTVKTVEDLDDILLALQRYHLIRPEQQPERTGAGRPPSPWFLVNPRLVTNSANCANSSGEK